MAQTTDVLTYQEAAAVLGNPTDDQDKIETLIAAVSDQLDALCGPVIQRTVTSESHDGCGHVVRLRERPVAGVLAAVEYDGTNAQTLTTESNTAKTAYDVHLDGPTGALYRRSSNRDWSYPDGRGNVVVTYTAGRFTHTTASDANLSKFKQAALLMCRHVWAGTSGMGTETFPTAPVDDGGLSLLGPEVLNKVRGLLRGEFDTPTVA